MKNVTLVTRWIRFNPPEVRFNPCEVSHFVIFGNAAIKDGRHHLQTED